ncbi:MAG: N-acetylmuramoyl-L-alanine amidase [Desulfuromonadaceae bacterium]
MFILLYAGLAHAGPQQDYLNARADFYTLMKSNAKQQYRHNWDNVLTPLHDFVKAYPQHSKTPSAYYLLGKAYTRLSEISHLRSDLEQAVSMFTHLEQNFPRSSLADDAMFLRAQLYSERYSDSRRAGQICENLIGRYPDGDMRDAAERFLEESDYSRTQVQRKSGSRQNNSVADNAMTDVRYSIDPKRVRVVIETTAKTGFDAASLNSPARLYVDIPGVDGGDDLADRYSIERNDSVVETIRLGHSNGDTRVVCDLKRSADYNIFTLDDPARIVMDISNNSSAEISSDSREIREAPRAAEDHVDTLLANAADGHVDMVTLPPKKSSSRRLRIVVDAGHGGKDPGAVGANNLYEKDITLALSKRLARVLRQSLDCDVHLTRTEDVYLTLQQRTAIANRVGADVFISVHANASENKKVRGTETYFLNFSKNDKAVEVAARENNMSLREVGDLELILFDLMANSKINESSRLATEVQTSMISQLQQRFSSIRDLGVRQGPFYVLLGADMPSILVEAAFISNAQDAKLLLDRKFQETTVQGIARGVKAYLRGQNMVAEN